MASPYSEEFLSAFSLHSNAVANQILTGKAYRLALTAHNSARYDLAKLASKSVVFRYDLKIMLDVYKEAAHSSELLRRVWHLAVLKEQALSVQLEILEAEMISNIGKSLPANVEPLVYIPIENNDWNSSGDEQERD